MFSSHAVCILSLFFPCALTYTWPNPQLDFLEKLYYQQRGYDSLNFGSFVQTCGEGANLGPGRTNSAEWIRAAYHDTATADVTAGTGGLDASLAFELDRPENLGRALSDTLFFFGHFTTTASSMSDLIALGTVLAVEACTVSDNYGPVIIPFRAGRIDATGPGASGVPEPHQNLSTHVTSFEKQGFNQSEMITLVACGHSLGGVNGKDFPDIVPVKNDSTNVESKQHFDDTYASLDNRLATQFLANTAHDALAFGLNETTRSDFRVFTSDGNITVWRLASSNELFLQECGRLFGRMIDTVPSSVQLSEVIEPFEVKPDNIFMAVEVNGTMTIRGDIRIRTQKPGQPGSRRVLVHLKSWGLKTTQEPILAVAREDGTTTGLYPHSPSFGWWNFTTTVPIAQRPTTFTVEVLHDQDGRTVSKVHSNGGAGFPLETDLIPQHQLSCATAYAGRGYIMNVTVAVRDDADLKDITLILPVPMPQPGSKHAPTFERHTKVMERREAVGNTGYSLFTANLTTMGKPVNTYVLWYALSARGKNREIEMPFVTWKGFSSCKIDNGG